MPRPVQRPPVVTVFAILQIVFGSIGLLLSLCGVGGALIMMSGAFDPTKMMPAGDPGRTQLERQLQLTKERLPYAQSYGLADALLGMGVTAAMLVSGVGMLKLRPGARKLAMACAFVSIVRAIVNVTIQLIMIPIQLKIAEEVYKGQPGADVGAVLGGYVGVGVTAFFAIYPVLVLIFMNRGDVVAAFSGKAPLRDDENDYDDREDDYDDPKRARGKREQDEDEDEGRFRPKNRDDD